MKAKVALSAWLAAAVLAAALAGGASGAPAGAPAGAPEGAPAGAQFVNGAFDQGVTGWVQSSTGGYDIIGNVLGEGISALSKPNAAWLGGAESEIAAVEQVVTITSAASLLRYWEWIESTETACAWDLARVVLDGATVATTGLCLANNTEGWVKRLVDLSAFEGQDVLVRFEVSTDRSFLSSQYLDDVALEANPLGPFTVTPARSGALVRLTWPHAAPYTGYEVWRSASPYFLPGAAGSEKRGDVPPPAGATATFDDSGATGNASANYFYLVRGSGSGATRVSNRTAEFDFNLVKGG